MQNETCSDHQREEDIDRDRNREVWNANIGGCGFHEVAPLCDTEVVYDARCYVSGVSWVSLPVWGPEARTKGCKIHQAREGNDPVAHPVNNVTAVKLGSGLH